MEEVGKSWAEFLRLTIPPLTIAAVFLVLPLLFFRTSRRNLNVQSATLLAAFCLIGIIPGIVAGYSQQAIAGTFLTATVGIVSALLSYGFAKESLAEWRPLIPAAMLFTLVGALAGFSTGGVAKHRWIYFDQEVQQQQFASEKLRGPVEAMRRETNFKRLALAKKDYIGVGDVVAVNDPPLEDTHPPQRPSSSLRAIREAITCSGE